MLYSTWILSSLLPQCKPIIYHILQAFPPNLNDLSGPLGYCVSVSDHSFIPDLPDSDFDTSILFILFPKF